MITAQTPQQFNDPLPDAVDVVIIGAGIIGVCTAWYLSAAGLKVLLCEKGRVAGEQSSRNWGWVRQHGRDPAELPVMVEAHRIWQTLAASVGEDLGFRQHGVVYLASTDKRLAQRERWLEQARACQVKSEMLTATQLQKLFNCPADRWVGGCYTPSDARAEPWIAVPAIARAAHRQGVVIREHCAVRTLNRTAGEVSGVVTEHGAVSCEQVVLAGGAWSSLFSANAGIRLPQLSVRSTVVSTTPCASVFDGNAGDEQLAFRRRQDNGYTLALTDVTEHFVGPDSFRHGRQYTSALMMDWQTYRLRARAPTHFPDGWFTGRRFSADQQSPFERMRVLDPPPNRKFVKRALQRFHARFPMQQPVGIAHSWAGMIDTMPDIVPVIDRVADCPGLIMATGFSGHGFGIGPGAAKIVAALVQQQNPGHDIHRFRYKRFTDGSPIEMGPAL